MDLSVTGARQSRTLKNIPQPHIDSFNDIFLRNFEEAVTSLPPVTIYPKDLFKLTFKFKSIELVKPVVDPQNPLSKPLFPSYCRVFASSYNSVVRATIAFSVDDRPQEDIVRQLTAIPVMVQSLACNLHGLTPKQLIKNKEDEHEWGGYFICNGIERLIRMLVVQKRNYPFSLVRASFRNRVPGMSEYAVSMRCVSRLELVANNVLHYMGDGKIMVGFSVSRQTFYFPFFVVLRALVERTDVEFYHEYGGLLGEMGNQDFYLDAVKDMLTELQVNQISTSFHAKQYIGKILASKIFVNFVEGGEQDSYEAVAERFLGEHILIHLVNKNEKYKLFLLMAQKLLYLVNEKCVVETVDHQSHSELLLPGQLYLMYVRERFDTFMRSFANALRNNLNKLKSLPVNESLSLINGELDVNFLNTQINTCMTRFGGMIGNGVENFLKTGNLYAKNSNLITGIPQASGLSILAERLNFMRYISHFRSVHRGSFFASSYSTTVRKLLPESWGYICPVHTPDGSPCGLLLHLTANCVVYTKGQADENFRQRYECFLLNSEMYTENESVHEKTVPILFDGAHFGFVKKSKIYQVLQCLMEIKLSNQNDHTEIVYTGSSEISGEPALFPLLLIYTNNCRLTRVVIETNSKKPYNLSPFEQLFNRVSLNLTNKNKEAHSNNFCFAEKNRTDIFSEAAMLIPFPEYNQSPRNMYQCQMAKQSLGTPNLNFFRFDNKMYYLKQFQTPICKNITFHNEIKFDHYPQGFNAVIVVLSYTGYDMEDALIIKKSSLERGMAAAEIEKTMNLDLNVNVTDKNYSIFATNESVQKYIDEGLIDTDGLPTLNRKLTKNTVLYSTMNLLTNQIKLHYYDKDEVAVVSQVVLLNSDVSDSSTNIGKSRALIKTRILRSPVVGDKFATRHGQKGILSMLRPDVDMPFLESGQIPDIIFNPHGFPSRMTVGMLIEIMAGKACLLEGRASTDSTAFQREQNLVDYFGEMLKKNGYNYYGCDNVYSGVSGQMLEAKVYTGVVHYQRLRHMVADKYQVRSTGPVDSITKQPVKGKSKGGGVRFGEMERDALISHGTSFLLQERLLHSSDGVKMSVCRDCGDLISCRQVSKNADSINYTKKNEKAMNSCSLCGESKSVNELIFPHVLKFLVAELSAVNVKLKIGFE